MIDVKPRITSGDLKGRKIKLPKFNELRVVRDKVRQAIFMILGDKVKNARVLDAFAGSGILGLESLSRGASFVDFTDENKLCIQNILENAKILGIAEKIQAVTDKAIGFMSNSRNQYDLIFLDPFYSETKHKFLLKVSEESLAEGGVIVFLHAGLNLGEQIEKLNLELFEERKYGQTTVTYLKKK